MEQLKPNVDGKFLVEPRNVSGTWSDKDYVAFHCFFTCLCNFIEEEHGGIEKFADYVNDCDLQNEVAGYIEFDMDWGYKTCRLYDWYTSTDWETYDFVGSKEVVEKLKEAADCFQGWWR